MPAVLGGWAAIKASESGKTTEGKLVRGGIAGTGAVLMAASPPGQACIALYGAYRIGRFIYKKARK